MSILPSQTATPIDRPYETHIPIVILIDTSGSMEGTPIQEVNKGIGTIQEVFSNLYSCVDLCLISFGAQVQIEVPFRSAKDFVPPTLRASGLSKMNEAIAIGLRALMDGKSEYRTDGVNYRRPILIVLADGNPTDEA